MDRLGILVAGELDRLKKYNLFTALTVLRWKPAAGFISGPTRTKRKSWR